MQYSCRYCSSPLLTVSQYQWQSVLFPSGEVFSRDEFWSLSKQSAEKRLKDHNARDFDVPCSCGDVIESRQVPLPDTADIIKWIYHYHMKKLILKLARPEMEEKSSMTRDAIFQTKVEDLFMECKCRIFPCQVKNALEKIIEALDLNLPYYVPDTPAVTLIARTINRDLLKDIKADRVKDMQQCFFRFFDDICPELE